MVRGRDRSYLYLWSTPPNRCMSSGDSALEGSNIIFFEILDRVTKIYHFDDIERESHDSSDESEARENIRRKGEGFWRDDIDLVLVMEKREKRRQNKEE